MNGGMGGHVLVNEYETNLIVRGDLDEASTYALVEKFEGLITGSGGTLLLRDDWGKRKLAYAIQRQPRCHFLILNWLGPAKMVAEFERRIRNEDQIVRFLTIRVGVAVDTEARLAQAEEQRRIRAEQAKARAEAEALAEVQGEEDEDYDN